VAYLKNTSNEMVLTLLRTHNTVLFVCIHLKWSPADKINI